MESSDLSAVFRENVRRLLESRGWTQAALAEKMGVKQPVVGRMLSQSRFPSGATLDAISKAFDVEICDLLCPKTATAKKK